MALLRSDEPFLYLRKDHLPVVVWFDENTGGGFDRRELAAVTPLDPVSPDDIRTVVRVLLHVEEEGWRLLGMLASRRPRAQANARSVRPGTAPLCAVALTPTPG